MKKLLLALLLAPTLAIGATGDKVLLPTSAQAALALAGDNESKMLIFGYVAGMVQGILASKGACVPPGKTPAGFTEEITDIIIEALIDPSVAKSDALLITDVTRTMTSRFPCTAAHRSTM